jgi:release factor glutamine methyltransferase
LQRITDKDKLLTEEQGQLLAACKDKLAAGMPMQYVLGYAWFMGRRFIVNEHVLIPRPETEELVQWIADDYKETDPAILDIGTGSGCIPVSLKLLLSKAKVSAIDVSAEALEVARTNAKSLDADVVFQQMNFLDTGAWESLPQYDVIVSNPPYIPETERLTLAAHVREYEPGLALFVPGDDALLFYRHIAEFGMMHLLQEGSIYCELHVDYATATEELFKSMGYSFTELRADMHGNLRMLKAKR